MSDRAPNSERTFTPIESKEDWIEQGWAMQSEPLTAATRVGAMISIRLDPDDTALVRQAAKLLGISRVEFVRRAAIAAAAETTRR